MILDFLDLNGSLWGLMYFLEFMIYDPILEGLRFEYLINGFRLV
jgi:hypothetical protein